MKSLYAVACNINYVVAAESLDEAGKVARRSLSKAACDVTWDECALSLKKVTAKDDLPAPWDGTCLAYTNDDDQTTIEEYLQALGIK